MMLAPPTDWLSAAGWLRLDLLGRLLLAAVLGGIVGLERELSGKPAGFRTNLLICVGAALFTDLSIQVARIAGGQVTPGDPTRIAAQIVSGIGFLGAGTILQMRGSITGLTTAATLWVVAAIGMAVGAHEYVEAVGTTLLVIIALLALYRVEEVLRRHRAAHHTLEVTMLPQPELIPRLEALLREHGFRVESDRIDKSPDGLSVSYSVSGTADAWERAMPAMLEIQGVLRVNRL